MANSWLYWKTCRQHHDADFPPRLEAAGFEVTAMNARYYPWCFDDEAAMVFYCRNMFGIDRTSDAKILAGLRDYLDYRIAL